MANSNSNIQRPALLREQLENLKSNRVAALSIACAAAISLAPNGHAQDEMAEEEDSTKNMEVVYVYGQQGADYKAKVSGDARRLGDLADIPATITALTQESLSDAGVTDLRETLSRQPGITLGTGENGNAFGDRYIIRGFEARSDVFVDGLRDPGMTIRETFAVEQLEITKGPSSTFAGRGSTGGAVNSITKQANPDARYTAIEAGLGSDEYRRLSLDTNLPISEKAALRINAVHGFEEVPDRSPADRERNGIAASLLVEPTEKLSFVTDFYYLDASGDTDLGTYIVANGDPVDDIPVYLQSEDFLESQVTVGTFKAIYELTPQFRIQNTLRYGETENGYLVTGARGTTGYATNPDIDPDATAFDTFGLSTHQGWQEVEYFVDQLNAFWDVNLGGLEHQFVIGAEYSDLNVLNGRFNVTNTGTTNCFVPGRAPPGQTAPFFGSYCGLNADGTPATELNNLLLRDIERGSVNSDYHVETVSFYLMDTVALTERLNLFAGLRLDSFDYSNDVSGFGGDQSFAYSDDLWNGHVGLVYDLTNQGNVYFTVSSSSNINGGESDVGANCGYGGLCGSPDQVSLGDPEDTINLELGTKWDLLDEKLLLTAAAFQITKSNVMEGVRGLDYSTLGTLNTAEIEVSGIEFGASGNVTDSLSVQAGATFMSAEITKSADAASIGASLANFADESAYAQACYEVTPDIAFGGAVTYRSEMGAGQPDSAASETYVVPSYAKLDLFAEYQINESYSVKLNLGNVTNEDYYTASYRSGAFTYKGDAFNTRLTLRGVF